MHRMDRVSAGNWTPTQLTTGSLRSFRPHHVGNLLTYVRGTYIAFGNFFDCVIMGART